MFFFDNLKKGIWIMVLAQLFVLSACADTIPSRRKPLMMMDMVHHNPGMAPTNSQFLDPHFLKDMGYDAKVFFLFEAAQFGINWQNVDPTIFPDHTKGRDWVEDKKKTLNQKYNAAKAAGLKVYCMLDMLVFPSSLINKHKAEMCNEQGKLDITKPFTQSSVKQLLYQMFADFPQLDGLVIRTGETYLHDAPYYAGGHPVIHSMQDHVVLLNLLRSVVCEELNKKLFYRTWDIGEFHSLPSNYLKVTDQVKPHENLYFSIKHTNVDFWRSAPVNPKLDFSSFDKYWLDEASENGVYFNPCIGIGQHQQIVEAQCEREYEGKGSQPNYIAKGVIDGFSELRQAGVPQPNNLAQAIKNPLVKGLWTWSRGGGWGGPFVKNEFWPTLNAYVLTKWAKQPKASEKEILESFAISRGLPKGELKKFRKLCLLSLDGVLKGQYSEMGGVFVNWTRDDNITGDFFLTSYFDEIIANGKVEAYLKEKEEASKIWREIEKLAYQLHFKEKSDLEFVRASCTYARLKFELFEIAWHIMLKGYLSQKTGNLTAKEIIAACKQYEQKEKAWENFVNGSPLSPTIYKRESDFFGRKVGIGTTVAKYREMAEKHSKN